MRELSDFFLDFIKIISYNKITLKTFITTKEDLWNGLNDFIQEFC